MKSALDEGHVLKKKRQNRRGSALFGKRLRNVK
jgi:hypothetical protein